MSKSKVICIGEALIDRLIDKSDLNFKNYMGGAPANVACALQKLGVSTAFIGCVGDDEYGNEFVKLFQKLNVNIDFLQINQNSSTRVVKVVRDEKGDRSFAGFENLISDSFADEMLDKSELKNKIIDLRNLFLETKFIIMGSNIMASKEANDSLNFMLKLAKQFDVKIVIDVNWREIFWKNVPQKINNKTFDKFEKIKNFLHHADILKLANEEASLFFDKNDPHQISQDLIKKPDVIVTNGSKPIFWYINGVKGQNEVINSKQIIDTTGAGDAFLAGLISKLCKDSFCKNELTISSYVKFASICGFLTCLGEGAIENQPNEKVVYEVLENFDSEM